MRRRLHMDARIDCRWLQHALLTRQAVAEAAVASAWRHLLGWRLRRVGWRHRSGRHVRWRRLRILSRGYPRQHDACQGAEQWSDASHGGRTQWRARCSMLTEMRRSVLPHLPGRFAGRPQRFERGSVTQRVHWLPEAVAAVGTEFAIARQALKRLGLPRRVVTSDTIEYARVQHEEAAADQCIVTGRLLGETGHLAGAVRRIVPGSHCRDRGELAMLPVEGDQRAGIDI